MRYHEHGTARLQNGDEWTRGRGFGKITAKGTGRAPPSPPRPRSGFRRDRDRLRRRRQRTGRRSLDDRLRPGGKLEGDGIGMQNGKPYDNRWRHHLRIAHISPLGCSFLSVCDMNYTCVRVRHPSTHSVPPPAPCTHPPPPPTSSFHPQCRTPPSPSQFTAPTWPVIMKYMQAA